MKKQLKVMVAALAVTALATPAFALTVDTKGFFEIRGQADRNMRDGSDSGTVATPSTDNDRAAVEQRLRLWTEAAADENVKAVFAFEIDNAWGRYDTAGKEVGTIGSDAKGQIEIKHAYLDFNLVSLNTNVKAGAQMFKIGGGYIANDDASGIQTLTKFGEAAALKLYWVKAVEGQVNVGSDDIDFYAAQLDVKAGPLTISPLFANTRNQKNADIYFAGLDLNGKFGENTRLAATFVKNWGDKLPAATNTAPAATDQKVDGLAAYVGIFQTMGAADLSLEGAYVGDDGRNDGQFVDGSGTEGVWGASSPTEMLGGARYDRRVAIGQGLGGFAAGGDGDLYTLNQAYVKLGFGLKTSDTTKLSTYVAHIQAATSGPGAANAKHDSLSNAYGQEVGAYYDITIGKGLTYSLMGAYLFNDDFGTVSGGNDNVYKLGNALTYKF